MTVLDDQLQRAIAEKGITYLPGGVQKTTTRFLDIFFPPAKTSLPSASTTAPAKWYENIPKPVIYGTAAGAALLLLMALKKKK